MKLREFAGRRVRQMLAILQQKRWMATHMDGITIPTDNILNLITILPFGQT